MFMTVDSAAANVIDSLLRSPREQWSCGSGANPVPIWGLFRRVFLLSTWSA